MSSPLFENIFGTYLTDRQLLAEFTGAQVESLQLSRASRFMSATLVCGRFIEIEKIDAAEKALSAALSLRGVELTPRYPADSLSVACFPTIVAFLRRRSAAVNGTFDDAVCRIEGDRLTVSLRHGCLNILRATKTDALLAEMLRTLFSRRMELQFEGDEGVDTADEHYQQMMAKAEEEAAASARAFSGIWVTSAAQSLMSAICTMSGLSMGRPLASKIFRTARPFRASAARP